MDTVCFPESEVRLCNGKYIQIKYRNKHQDNLQDEIINLTHYFKLPDTIKEIERKIERHE